MPVSNSAQIYKSVYFMPFKTVLKNCSFLSPLKPQIPHMVIYKEEIKEVPRNQKEKTEKKERG
jgi:hypothetical protein